MTFAQFQKKYLGKKVDWDGAYAGQCVDLFRQYVNDVLGLQQPKGVVGAKDFWTNYETDPILNKNFKKIANTPTGVPQEGDVIIWDAYTGNPYGHISIFIKGDANKFVSLDQNFPTLSKVTETEHNYTKPKVLGWLRPMVTQETVNNVTITELKIKNAELLQALDKEKANAKKLNDLLNETKKELETQRTRYLDLEEDCKEDKELLQKTISEKQLEINELAEINEKLLEETKLWNALKNAVISFKDKYVQKIQSK